MNNYIPHTEIQAALETYSREWQRLIQSQTKPLSPLPTEISPSLPVLKGVKTVVFDIYGTLLISGSGEVGTFADRSPEFKSDRPQALSFHRAFSAIEVTPSVSAEKFNEVCSNLYFNAIQQRHAQLKQSGVDYPEVDILEIWQSIWNSLDETRGTELHASRLIKLALEYELAANPTWPMTNARKTVQKLSRDGCLLGIVSNAQFYTPLILEALLEGSLDETGFSQALRVWSYQTGRAKPSRRMFDPLLETLRTTHGIRPGEVLYVGNDMLNDVYTAALAGCKTALFAGDRRSLRLRKENSFVQSRQPDAIITDISQLHQILELRYVKE
jgi:putative hydrolase of the HAD superfamily